MAEFCATRGKRKLGLSRPLVLASASPRRIEILGQSGLQFEVLPMPSDEEMSIDPNVPPRFNAERAALAKTRWAAVRRPKAVILGADTVVVLDGVCLGKPVDAEDARQMISLLSGRSHKVVTAFVILAEDIERRSYVETCVRFRPLMPDDINRYVECGEYVGKAGAYAIQGAGGNLVDFIQGSYTNVVGLPLHEVLTSLSDSGVLRVNLQAFEKEEIDAIK